jgi:tRNA-dihydrouridine synthase A
MNPDTVTTERASAAPASPYRGRRLSVAPMMDWTDRHCRKFHREITRHTWLYTEMVTTGALVYGDVGRHLRFNDEEHPVALQLGGSDPADLAKSAKLGQEWGYDEINLNCGCPSERVQKGAFGACLMAEPQLVADCVKAMRDAVSIAGCNTFIVHARNAVLKGLSPKENREIPPLRYEVAYQLKREFPGLEIIINGGIKTSSEVAAHLEHVDGVMLGREAYHNPYVMAEYDSRFYGDDAPVKTRIQVLEAMIPYIEAQIALHGAHGLKLNTITRHMLGIMAGLPGARSFRQVMSDPARLAAGDARLLLDACARLPQV